jgi:CRP-like cAMP-binding protein
MTDQIFRELACGLSAAGQFRLKEILSHRRHLRPHEDVIRQGETPNAAYFVLEGFLCRYKLLSGGRRATLAYLLPSDFCGHPEFHATMDHSVGSITAATVAEVPHQMLQDCLRSEPLLARNLSAAFWTQFAIQRQWLANMGCPSDKRLAHLLCELRARLAKVHLADERSFLLPLTQHELSEALGISTVHVNRVLQHLKEIGLVRIMDRRVLIADLAALENFAEFDGSYLGLTLHQDEARHLSAAG